MKKLILVILSAALLLSSFTTVAYARTVNISLPWTNNIRNISDSDTDGKGHTVSKFTDDGNECYVAMSDNNYNGSPSTVAISCVRIK